ncbi:hypothetical protein KAR91_70925 [Candidatus Pacearchaeota archaeon]|nr:hypothetical protein [Candidatus Pacearchaeota archaeon]
MTLFVAVVCFVVGMTIGHWFKNKRSRFLAKELEKAIYFASSMKNANEELIKKIEKFESICRKNSVDEMRIGLHEALHDMQMENM